MLKSYEVVTRCQKEILNCELSKIDRLQLEMCLIRVKLALLAYDKDETKCKNEMNDIYDQICSLSRRGSNTKEIKGIVTRLQNLAKGMKKQLDMPGKG